MRRGNTINFKYMAKSTHGVNETPAQEIKRLKEELKQAKIKAKKWDDLREQIGKYYSEDEHGNQEEPGDLGDIGETAALAFGFL